MHINVNIEKSIQFNIQLEYQQKYSIESVLEILIKKKKSRIASSERNTTSDLFALRYLPLIISSVHSSSLTLVFIFFHFSSDFKYISSYLLCNIESYIFMSFQTNFLCH